MKEKMIYYKHDLPTAHSSTCSWQSTKRRMFLLTNRGDGGFGSTNEMHVNEAKVWVKQRNSPPLPADFTEQGKDNTILVMIPGQEKWKYVPLTHYYSREQIFLEIWP